MGNSTRFTRCIRDRLFVAGVVTTILGFCLGFWALVGITIWETFQ